MSNHDYAPIAIASPGEYLRDELEARGLAQEDLARIMGRPLKTVNAVIKGSKQLTGQTARELGAALGTSADLWMNLEAQYRLSLAEAPSDEVAQRAELYEFAPIREMQKRGWLPSTQDIAELQKSVLDVFRIRSLEEEPPLAAAMRAAPAPTVERNACRAWVHGARLEARPVSVAGFKRASLPGLVKRLRSLVRDPGAVTQVRGLMAEVGIRFVVVPHLPKTRIAGAMFYLDDAKRQPVIAITLRTNMHDSFWFTLMHELAHLVLNHGPTIDVDESANSPEEQAADELAASWLLDVAAYKDFKARGKFSAREIASFALSQSTHVDIVLGRLKKEGALQWPVQRASHAKVRELLSE